MVGNFDRHIILYIKNHYEQSEDILDNLKKLWRMRVGNFHDRDIIPAIADKLMEWSFKLCHNYQQFSEIIEKLKRMDISEKDNIASIFRFEQYYNTPFNERLIRACISTIMLCKVKDIEEILGYELGEPDPNILPLRKEKLIDFNDYIDLQNAINNPAYTDFESLIEEKDLDKLINLVKKITEDYPFDNKQIYRDLLLHSLISYFDHCETSFEEFETEAYLVADALSNILNCRYFKKSHIDWEKKDNA